MAYSDRELLARIVQCEAGGEGDNGMKAVATVVLNRVNTTEGEYARISQGGNIRNIIYQKGQFDCATETLLNQYNSQNIYNMNPTDIHYYIADWALAGNRLNEIGECLWYLNPFKPNCSSVFPSNGSGTPSLFSAINFSFLYLCIFIFCSRPIKTMISKSCMKS